MKKSLIFILIIIIILVLGYFIFFKKSSGSCAFIPEIDRIENVISNPDFEILTSNNTESFGEEVLAYPVLYSLSYGGEKGLVFYVRTPRTTNYLSIIEDSYYNISGDSVTTSFSTPLIINPLLVDDDYYVPFLEVSDGQNIIYKVNIYLKDQECTTDVPY